MSELINHRCGEEATSKTAPPTRVIVLDEGRIVFTGSVAEFETNPLRAIARLTHADNGTEISDFPVADPWDKTRKPRERIL